MNKTVKTLICQSIAGVNGETVMADRKARSVVFKRLECFSTNDESDYEHEIWKKVLKSMR